MIIQSDASLIGWVAVCGGTHTGRPWSLLEREMHINCLELKAATLALQIFAKDLMGISVLLQLDDQTTVVCINHLGAQSPTADCWQRTFGDGLCRDITLVAQV